MKDIKKQNNTKIKHQSKQETKNKSKKNPQSTIKAETSGMK